MRDVSEALPKRGGFTGFLSTALGSDVRPFTSALVAMTDKQTRQSGKNHNTPAQTPPYSHATDSLFRHRIPAVRIAVPKYYCVTDTISRVSHCCMWMTSHLMVSTSPRLG